jgi:hypothetical protein
MTEICGRRLFRQLLADVKAATALVVHVDEADGLLSIRVQFMGQDFLPHSAFWQVRRVYRGDSENLCSEVIRSFTTSPCPSEILAGEMLSLGDFAKKLKGFCADGASVNGVRRDGRPVAEPREGDNMAWKLQEFKASHTSEKLLVAWCASHRSDLLADSVDKLPQFEQLAELVRRLCSHVGKSMPAQGALKAIHAVLSDAMSGGPGGMTFAPHRFCSMPSLLVCLRVATWRYRCIQELCQTGAHPFLF